MFPTEFPCGTMGEVSGIVTAAAQVVAVAWVQSLAGELPYVSGVAKRKKIFFHVQSFLGPEFLAILGGRNE